MTPFRKIIITSLIVICTQVSLIAGSIKITVKDQQDTPLPGATVGLTNASDSAVIHTITDQNGIATFELDRDGIFIVRATFVGFEPAENTIMVRPGVRSFELQMLEQVLSLGEVTVTARRPLIRQEGDKMIIDPEPLANISTNTLEMLETVPGVFVDQEGGIFLNSATPATILINGREQRMGQDNITSLLRSLPPGSIQHIEVIRTPSVRYSASASGGIINIVLKRGVRLGRFGGVNMGFNQGVLGNRFVGLNFNDSGDNLTFYLNANYNHNASQENLSSIRLLPPVNDLQHSAIIESRSNNGLVGFGLSFEPSESLKLSYDGRIDGSIPRSETFSTNIMRAPLDNVLSENISTIENNSRSLNIQQDIGLLYRIDTLGSTLDTRVSYNFISGSSTQDHLTDFFIPSPISTEGIGDNSFDRQFIDMQSDLTLKLPFEITLETGLRASFQEFNSRGGYHNRINDELQEDLRRANVFRFSENINAGYVQASRDLPLGLHLRTGFRLEHSHMYGQQSVPADTSFLIDRVDFFPYAFLSRRLVEIAGAELRGFVIYRRSISRPSYQNLNPHIRFLDQFLFETGNPSLRPQFTENIEANISFNEMPLLAIGRNYIRDIFSQVVYTDNNDNNIAIRTYDNVGKNTETYFRGIIGIPPGGRYFMAAGAQYNLNHYEGLYENEPLSFRRGSWRFFTFHSLSVTPNTRLTLLGFMMHRGMFNFYEMDDFGMLNLGLSHHMLDRRLQITISARDVLRTMETNFAINQGSSIATGSRYTDNRRFGINIRYNFGVQKREEPQQPQMEFNMTE